MCQSGLRAGEHVLLFSASGRRGGGTVHWHGKVPQCQHTGQTETESAGGHAAVDGRRRRRREQRHRRFWYDQRSYIGAKLSCFDVTNTCSHACRGRPIGLRRPGREQRRGAQGATHVETDRGAGGEAVITEIIALAIRAVGPLNTPKKNRVERTSLRLR